MVPPVSPLAWTTSSPPQQQQQPPHRCFELPCNNQTSRDGEGLPAGTKPFTAAAAPKESRNTHTPLPPEPLAAAAPRRKGAPTKEGGVHIHSSRATTTLLAAAAATHFWIGVFEWAFRALWRCCCCFSLLTLAAYSTTTTNASCALRADFCSRLKCFSFGEEEEETPR